MNNYNSALCILSGVQNFTVHRLKKTWEELDKSSRDGLEVTGDIFGGNSEGIGECTFFQIELVQV
jgi:hypothetical protein